MMLVINNKFLCSLLTFWACYNTTGTFILPNIIALFDQCRDYAQIGGGK